MSFSYSLTIHSSFCLFIQCHKNLFPLYPEALPSAIIPFSLYHHLFPQLSLHPLYPSSSLLPPSSLSLTLTSPLLEPLNTLLYSLSIIKQVISLPLCASLIRTFFEPVKTFHTISSPPSHALIT